MGSSTKTVTGPGGASHIAVTSAGLLPLTHTTVLNKIKLQVDQAGSLRIAAARWGISHVQLHRVLANKRTIGPKLLKALKLRRVRYVIYRYESIN